MTQLLSLDIEEFRDQTWRREESLRVDSVYEAEQFIREVGFCSCLTDSRRPGPSLYIAVCGRRDAVMPRNVQKDPESSHTWNLKDELLRRGKVYYGKLARGKTMFIAPELIQYFHAVFGVSKRDEKNRLSPDALAILKVLRSEWESATSDLRKDSGIDDRKAFTKAIDELQTSMIVIPSNVIYKPKFTYIWALAEGRFSKQLSQKVDRNIALREIARSFLKSANITVKGELARVAGLSRPDAGIGNRALVEEKLAVMISEGNYSLINN